MYNTLQQRVDESCDLRDQMGNQLKKLEEQQKQTFQVVDHLQAQQKTYQTQTVQAIANFAQLQIQTHKEIGNLQAQQDTYQIETNESIENIKTEQEEYHRKTDEAIGDLRNKAGQTWIPSEEGNVVFYLTLILFTI